MVTRPDFLKASLAHSKLEGLLYRHQENDLPNRVLKGRPENSPGCNPGSDPINNPGPEGAIESLILLPLLSPFQGLHYSVHCPCTLGYFPALRWSFVRKFFFLKTIVTQITFPGRTEDAENSPVSILSCARSVALRAAALAVTHDIRAPAAG